MKPTRIPLVKDVFESGADDRLFDTLLLTGPFLIIFVAVLGRSTVTTALVVAYLLVFVTYIPYKWAR